MTGAAVAWASLNGTIELLVLSLAGGYLAHLGVLTGAAVRTLSEMMVHVLLPALMYISVLDGVHTALSSRTSSSLAAMIFPPLWGIVVPALGGVVAFLAVHVIARGKAESVRRVILVCAMMGNAGNMPLLIMTALCDNFAPLGKDPRCVQQSAALSSLFCVTWNIVLWSPVFAYLVSAPDVESEESEEFGLLGGSQTPTPDRPGLISPPLIAIMVALGSVLIPRFPEAVLSQGGPLSPITSSVRLLGNMVVPTSSIIVGSRLYESQTKTENPAKLGIFVPERKRFGVRVHISILAIRMIILPFIGRLIYRVCEMWRIPGKLLGVFSLIELSVPTANSTVMVTVLVAQFLPNIGPQLEEDVATTIFYQYIAVPVFFTINSALALSIVFNEHH